MGNVQFGSTRSGASAPTAEEPAASCASTDPADAKMPTIQTRTTRRGGSMTSPINPSLGRPDGQSYVAEAPGGFLPNPARAGQPGSVAGSGKNAASTTTASIPSGNGQEKPSAVARLTYVPSVLRAAAIPRFLCPSSSFSRSTLGMVRVEPLLRYLLSPLLDGCHRRFSSTGTRSLPGGRQRSDSVDGM